MSDIKNDLLLEFSKPISISVVVAARGNMDIKIYEAYLAYENAKTNYLNFGKFPKQFHFVKYGIMKFCLLAVPLFTTQIYEEQLIHTQRDCKEKYVN
jgi:hypothetical protein